MELHAQTGHSRFTEGAGPWHAFGCMHRQVIPDLQKGQGHGTHLVACTDRSFPIYRRGRAMARIWLHAQTGHSRFTEGAGPWHAFGCMHRQVIPDLQKGQGHGTHLVACTDRSFPIYRRGRAMARIWLHAQTGHSRFTEGAGPWHAFGCMHRQVIPDLQKGQGHGTHLVACTDRSFPIYRRGRAMARIWLHAQTGHSRFTEGAGPWHAFGCMHRQVIPDLQKGQGHGTHLVACTDRSFPIYRRGRAMARIWLHAQTGHSRFTEGAGPWHAFGCMHRQVIPDLQKGQGHGTHLVACTDRSFPIYRRGRAMARIWLHAQTGHSRFTEGAGPWHAFGCMHRQVIPDLQKGQGHGTHLVACTDRSFPIYRRGRAMARIWLHAQTGHSRFTEGAGPWHAFGCMHRQVIPDLQKGQGHGTHLVACTDRSFPIYRRGRAMARIWLHAQTGHSRFTEGAGPWHAFGCMHRQVIPDLQKGQGHGTHLVACTDRSFPIYRRGRAMARIWLHAQTGHSRFTEGAGPWHAFGCMHRQVISDLQKGQGHGTHLVACTDRSFPIYRRGRAMARIWLHAQTGHSRFTEGAGPWHAFGCMHRQVISDLQKGQGHGTHLVACTDRSFPIYRRGRAMARIWLHAQTGHSRFTEGAGPWHTFG